METFGCTSFPGDRPVCVSGLLLQVLESSLFTVENGIMFKKWRISDIAECFTRSSFSCISLFYVAEPPEIAALSFPKAIMNEGDFAQLSCIVTSGDEPFTFTWSLHGDIVSSEPGLTTSQIGSRTSVLMINSVGYRHSGLYTCNVSNVAGTVISSAQLKVNGN